MSAILYMSVKIDKNSMCDKNSYMINQILIEIWKSKCYVVFISISKWALFLKKMSFLNTKFFSFDVVLEKFNYW